MKESIGLRCAHKFCTECYRGYLAEEIMGVNATERIYCAAGNCDKIVDSDFIMKFIIDADVRQMYKYLMANSFVQVRFSLYTNYK